MHLITGKIYSEPKPMAFNGGISDSEFSVAFDDGINNVGGANATYYQNIDETTNFAIAPNSDGDLDGDPNMISVGETFTVQFDFEGETYSIETTCIRSDPANIVFEGTYNGHPVEINVSPGHDLNDVPTPYYYRQDMRPGNGTIPCFVAGTLITTGKNVKRPLESLEPGDTVLSIDGTEHVVRWIGCKTVSVAEQHETPSKRPILIKAGALGNGMPCCDLQVSGQHRMMVSSKIARRMFGTDDVLVAAKHLVGIPGISVAPIDGPVTYLHILFDTHAIVAANDAPAESLLMGPQTRLMMSDAILGPFPLHIIRSGFAVEPARTIAQGHRMKKMVERHAQNGQPLLQLYGGLASRVDVEDVRLSA